MLSAAGAPVQGAPAATWTERKCALYAQAWDHLASGGAGRDAGAGFIAAQDAFIASGCRSGTVCPETEAERALADRLTLMAVAEGMTGSFLPFACPTRAP